MDVRVLSEKDVRILLPMQDCIGVMEEALRALAWGEAVLPLRPVMPLPGSPNLIGLMPAYLGNIRIAGVKVLSVFPNNQGTVFDSHQGAVLLFECEHGQLVAIVDATAITAVRTGAVSAAATKLLARPDAGDLALLGSGTQAIGHLQAMLAVRPIHRVRVWSVPIEHAQQFAERESRHFGIPIEVMKTAQEAVAGADLICTVTPSKTPVLKGEWIAPGAHINAVGASQASARELDTAAVTRSRLFVDRRESTLNESGDFLMAKNEGAIGDEHIRGEIGELLLGKLPGRTAPEEITLFKALGLAIEDLAAAHYAYMKSLGVGMGTSIELGGTRHGAT